MKLFITLQSNLNDSLIELFTKHGIAPFWAEPIIYFFTFLLSILFSYIIYKIAKRFIGNIFQKIAKTTKSNFDDFLIEKKVPQILSAFLSFIILSTIIPYFINEESRIYVFIHKTFDVINIFIFLLLSRAVLKTVQSYLSTVKYLKDKPIESYVQVIITFLWLIGGLIILSIATDKNIETFIATLGALSAVLLLIFKDTILGFVASIQISVNDTIRIGDWITMKSNNADGNVISINLTTVQIRNFDNTITSIPTYKLVSESFVNWRGMNNSNGRRIKRSMSIRISSIRFLTEEELLELEKIELLALFIQKQKKEISDFNSLKQINKSILINGRNITNIGLFRQYVEFFIKQHPEINQNMLLMCRQLAPTSEGIPIEIYTFSYDKRWQNYERIIADIFDHLLASIPYFHLECFEFTSSLKKLK